MFHEITCPDDSRDFAGHLDGADESAWEPLETIVSGLYDKRQRATARCAYASRIYLNAARDASALP